jgi:hypothetical protein
MEEPAAGRERLPRLSFALKPCSPLTLVAALLVYDGIDFAKTWPRQRAAVRPTSGDLLGHRFHTCTTATTMGKIYLCLPHVDVVTWFPPYLLKHPSLFAL